MRKAAKFIILFTVIIIGIGLYYFFAVYEKQKPEKIGVNEILNNPDEYNNPIYIRTLSSSQQVQLADSFDNLLYENCKDGKLNENCTLYFVYSYINARINLGEVGYIPKDSTEYTHVTSILRNVYSDINSNFVTLKEDDLKGFLVPVLAQFCRIKVATDEGKLLYYWINDTSRIYWAQKIIDINKTSWQSTDMQIFYLKLCTQVRNITQLSIMTGMNSEELNSKLCNMLPNLKDVNTEDLCYVNDYLKTKIFCEADITTEDKAIMNNLLSKEYGSYYQNDCKNKLSEVNSLLK